MAYANKEDQLAAQRRWYKNNTEKQKRWVKKHKRDLSAWFQAYKTTLVCSRCPESAPICLDFHHVGGKDFEIARMVTDGFSKERILKEIKKCVVLCANCHRKTHAGVV